MLLKLLHRWHFINSEKKIYRIIFLFDMRARLLFSIELNFPYKFSLIFVPVINFFIK